MHPFHPFQSLTFYLECTNMKPNMDSSIELVTHHISKIDWQVPLTYIQITMVIYLAFYQFNTTMLGLISYFNANKRPHDLAMQSSNLRLSQCAEKIHYLKGKQRQHRISRRLSSVQEKIHYSRGKIGWLKISRRLSNVQEKNPLLEKKNRGA